MLKKLAKLLARLAAKLAAETPPPPPPPVPPQPRISGMAQNPFTFPKVNSTVLPDPARFFSPSLLSAPLPTSSFFQNFVLNNGDQPEYIHPYLIKSSESSVSFSYPTRFSSPNFIYQIFNADLTVSSPSSSSRNDHVISSFHDLSVTLDIPPSLRFHLVRGSPFVTFETLCGAADVAIASINAFLSLTPNASFTKYAFQLNNGQSFLLYASSPIHLLQSDTSLLTAKAFSGVVRIAYLPDPSYEPVLDRFSACYPVSGCASLSKPFCLEYNWKKKGWGDLLLLAHPLHLRLLSGDEGVTVLKDIKYRSIDGDLVGVVGDSWLLRTEPVSPTWYSINGVSKDGCAEIIAALQNDVKSLLSSPITSNSSYFYGKAVARAARFALIAEEVGCKDVIPTVEHFLESSITPWLDGSFNQNGFLYDPKWGGILTKLGSVDSGADFGFGIYNDHHYHLGYFIYAIAVLAKIYPAWGRKYMAQAYSMVADFMSLSSKRGTPYTRLRMFDLWKLHSWAGGLTEFADGRNQESTSEAVNAYYAAALLGLSYGDTHLVAVGSTLLAFEILASQQWWHVREGDDLYDAEFTREQRLVGVLWNNKRDSGLWFAPQDWRECRLGIQVLPLLPITEVLFEDTDFARELVTWAAPALGREGVGEGWKGFVYSLQGTYDKETALVKTRQLSGHDDGNSLSNLLWWLHSRHGGSSSGRRCCWYRQYCH